MYFLKNSVGETGDVPVFSSIKVFYPISPVNSIWRIMLLHCIVELREKKKKKSPVKFVSPIATSCSQCFSFSSTEAGA